ncbi:MAG: hypothetical protein ABJE95_28820, partial [Byssovorax sp.]
MTRLTCFSWLSVATVLLLGCQSKVIGGGSGGSGGTGGGDVGMTTGTSMPPDTASSTGTGAPPSDDGPAIAMLRSELPAPSNVDGSSGITSTSGGPAEDPNSLFVFLSNVSQSCGDPFSATSGCATAKYQVTIVLPPALQAVGTYSLDQLATAGFSAPEGGNVCSGGGGSYWDGTIAITAVDATHV